MEEKEVFKPIRGYEGMYEISNFGTVISRCAGRWKTTMVRKPVMDKDGYLCIVLKKDGHYKGFKIHRLVADAFLDNPNDCPVINHKDHNRANNRADNLEWCTVAYNNTYDGKNRLYFKPVVQLSTDGEELNRFESVNEAAKSINTDPSNISSALHGRNKTSGGYVWAFQS